MWSNQKERVVYKWNAERKVGAPEEEANKRKTSCEEASKKVTLSISILLWFEGDIQKYGLLIVFCTRFLESSIWYLTKSINNFYF